MVDITEICVHRYVGRSKSEPAASLGVTRRQLTDDQWKFIEPYLPIGGFGPYPERLREQFEGVIWRFRSGAQWREMPGESGPWATV